MTGAGPKKAMYKRCKTRPSISERRLDGFQKQSSMGQRTAHHHHHTSEPKTCCHAAGLLSISDNSLSTGTPINTLSSDTHTISPENLVTHEKSASVPNQTNLIVVSFLGASGIENSRLCQIEYNGIVYFYFYFIFSYHYLLRPRLVSPSALSPYSPEQV